MASTTQTEETITRTLTWDGTATHGYSDGATDVPDDVLFAALPAGRLLMLQSAKMTVNSIVKTPFRQQDFIYNKVLGLEKPEVWTPNLDVVVHMPVDPDFVGTKVGGGGVGPNPGGFDDWVSWTQPIPLTASIRSQLGGCLGVGNNVECELVLKDAGPAQEILWVESEETENNSLTVYSPSVPADSEWMLTTAFIKASLAYAGTVERTGGSSTLATHPPTGAGSGPTQSSGGYSNEQCSVPLGGTQQVWQDHVVAKAGGHLTGTFFTQAAARCGLLVGIAETTG
jgi:hypothetical protein